MVRSICFDFEVLGSKLTINDPLLAILRIRIPLLTIFDPYLVLYGSKWAPGSVLVSSLGTTAIFQPQLFSLGFGCRPGQNSRGMTTPASKRRFCACILAFAAYMGIFVPLRLQYLVESAYILAPFAFQVLLSH